MTLVTCAAVITSYNRCADLFQTCEQLEKLDPTLEEVIICLDGCSDGSREMLARRFPTYRVVENAVVQGSIPSRDLAFRLVASDLILTLDDDSYPVDSAFVAKATAMVGDHPEAGAFTFSEIRDDGQPADARLGPAAPARYARDFPNCAGIIRRELYGTVAEYPRFFSHAYAEPDFCLQLYAAGWAVWFEPSLSIRHHFVPRERNMLARHWLNARNELWSVLMRCPFPFVVVIAPLRVLRQLLFAFSRGPSWWIREPKWWLEALRGLPKCFQARKPVAWRSYYRWLRLGRIPLADRMQLMQRFPLIESRKIPHSSVRP